MLFDLQWKPKKAEAKLIVVNKVKLWLYVQFRALACHGL